MILPWNKRKREREHAIDIEREKSWWRFQANLDFAMGAIGREEYQAALTSIDLGKEYVGVGRR